MKRLSFLLLLVAGCGSVPVEPPPVAPVVPVVAPVIVPVVPSEFERLAASLDAESTELERLRAERDELIGDADVQQAELARLKAKCQEEFDAHRARYSDAQWDRVFERIGDEVLAAHADESADLLARMKANVVATDAAQDAIDAQELVVSDLRAKRNEAR